MTDGAEGPGQDSGPEDGVHEESDQLPAGASQRGVPAPGGRDDLGGAGPQAVLSELYVRVSRSRGSRGRKAVAAGGCRLRSASRVRAKSELAKRLSRAAQAVEGFRLELDRRSLRKPGRFSTASSTRPSGVHDAAVASSCARGAAIATSGAGKPAPPLSEKDVRAAENDACVGGLRAPWRSVRRLPMLAHLGRGLRQLLERFVDDNVWTLALANGGDAARCIVDRPELDELRRSVAGACGVPDCDVSPGARTPWRPGVVEAHIQAAKDPETELVGWLRTGAPIGVARPIVACGVFPPAKGGSAQPGADDALGILADSVMGGNYKSFEEARVHALPELQRTVKAGYAVHIGTWRQVVAKFGRVVVSKLACILKARKNGGLKVRLVVDLRRSQVNRCAQVPERVVLPRIKEVLENAVTLLHAAAAGQEVEAMVVDFKDAFHSLPVHDDEKKYGVARTEGDDFVYFDTIMFGGVGSPLVWGRAGAYLMRGAQALFEETELLCECYVDDPNVLAVGDRRERQRRFVIFLLWLCIMGPPISWDKVARGRCVEWCGVELRLIDRYTVKAVLAEEFVRTLREEIEEAMSRPLVKLSVVRRIAGRASWAMGLVPVLRSFLDSLWAVGAELAAQVNPKGSGKAKGRSLRAGGEPVAETSRIMISLLWLRAFLARLVGTGELGRTIDTRVWMQGPTLRITCDASPWGLGATLEVEGRFEAYLTDALTSEDAKGLGFVIGSCRAQAIVKTLALAVALRTWLPSWSTARAVVRARSDSQAALGALKKGASGSPAINRIVREIALDIALSKYGVDFVEHVRGKDNDVADDLSRLDEPGAGRKVPWVLEKCRRSPVQARDAQWWEADLVNWVSAEARAPPPTSSGSASTTSERAGALVDLTT